MLIGESTVVQSAACPVSLGDVTEPGFPEPAGKQEELLSTTALQDAVLM